MPHMLLAFRKHLPKAIKSNEEYQAVVKKLSGDKAKSLFEKYLDRAIDCPVKKRLDKVIEHLAKILLKLDWRYSVYPPKPDPDVKFDELGQLLQIEIVIAHALNWWDVEMFDDFPNQDLDFSGNKKFDAMAAIVKKAVVEMDSMRYAWIHV